MDGASPQLRFDTNPLSHRKVLRIVRSMAAAENTSWAYTLSRIDERTEHIEKRLTQMEAELAAQRGEFAQLDRHLWVMVVSIVGLTVPLVKLLA